MLKNFIINKFFDLKMVVCLWLFLWILFGRRFLNNFKGIYLIFKYLECFLIKYYICLRK